MPTKKKATKKADDGVADQVVELEQENAALKDRVQELEGQLSEVEEQLRWYKGKLERPTGRGRTIEPL